MFIVGDRFFERARADILARAGRIEQSGGVSYAFDTSPGQTVFFWLEPDGSTAMAGLRDGIAFPIAAQDARGRFIANDTCTPENRTLFLRFKEVIAPSPLRNPVARHIKGAGKCLRAAIALARAG